MLSFILLENLKGFIGVNGEVLLILLYSLENEILRGFRFCLGYIEVCGGVGGLS